MLRLVDMSIMEQTISILGCLRCDLVRRKVSLCQIADSLLVLGCDFFSVLRVLCRSLGGFLRFSTFLWRGLLTVANAFCDVLNSSNSPSCFQRPAVALQELRHARRIDRALGFPAPKQFPSKILSGGVLEIRVVLNEFGKGLIALARLGHERLDDPALKLGEIPTQFFGAARGGERAFPLQKVQWTGEVTVDLKRLLVLGSGVAGRLHEIGVDSLGDPQLILVRRACSRTEF